MIEPHGGKLVNRLAAGSEREDLLKKAQNLLSIEVPSRYLSDCEMIAIGGYSPLTGFMSKDEVMSVLEKVELSSGHIWAIPIVLPVDKRVASEITSEMKLY